MTNPDKLAADFLFHFRKLENFVIDMALAKEKPANDFSEALFSLKNHPAISRHCRKLNRIKRLRNVMIHVESGRDNYLAYPLESTVEDMKESRHL